MLVIYQKMMLNAKMINSEMLFQFQYFDAMAFVIVIACASNLLVVGPGLQRSLWHSSIVALFKNLTAPGPCDGTAEASSSAVS